ncbi:MAG: protein-L-isoaspartate(D-aspartate) O-methyltransferase [Acidobacteriota bacterium]
MTGNLRRRQMVREQLLPRGIHSRRVLGAMLRVEREAFVPAAARGAAYEDHPVSIGEGQTISQPYMAAVMLQILDVHRGMKVLEVGAGSGYVLALLSAMGARPWGVEWHPRLAERIVANLASAGFRPAPVRAGDGGLGWPEEAPFDRILISAACPAVPPPLLEQLAPRGRLVAPVNEDFSQVLLRLTRTAHGFREETFDRCVFVPLQGRFARR